jgi:hypothetical protein
MVMASERSTSDFGALEDSISYEPWVHGGTHSRCSQDLSRRLSLHSQKCLMPDYSLAMVVCHRELDYDMFSLPGDLSASAAENRIAVSN